MLPKRPGGRRESACQYGGLGVISRMLVVHQLITLSPYVLESGGLGEFGYVTAHKALPQGPH